MLVVGELKEFTGKKLVQGQYYSQNEMRKKSVVL